MKMPESSAALDEELLPPVELPDVPLDEPVGVPLESRWHVLQIASLLDSISYWFRDPIDFYAAGNIFI